MEKIEQEPKTTKELLIEGKHLKTIVDALDQLKWSIMQPWEQDVTKWVFEQIGYTVEYPCEKMSLWRLGLGNIPEKEIKSFPACPTDAPKYDIDLLAYTITVVAQIDMDVLNIDTQTYVLYAIFPEAARYNPRKIFKISPPTRTIKMENDHLTMLR